MRKTCRILGGRILGALFLTLATSCATPGGATGPNIEDNLTAWKHAALSVGSDGRLYYMGLSPEGTDDSYRVVELGLDGRPVRELVRFDAPCFLSTYGHVLERDGLFYLVGRCEFYGRWEVFSWRDGEEVQHIGASPLSQRQDFWGIVEDGSLVRILSWTLNPGEWWAFRFEEGREPEQFSITPHSDSTFVSSWVKLSPTLAVPLGNGKSLCIMVRTYDPTLPEPPHPEPPTVQWLVHWVIDNRSGDLSEAGVSRLSDVSLDSLPETIDRPRVEVIAQSKDEIIVLVQTATQGSGAFGNRNLTEDGLTPIVHAIRFTGAGRLTPGNELKESESMRFREVTEVPDPSRRFIREVRSGQTNVFRYRIYEFARDGRWATREFEARR